MSWWDLAGEWSREAERLPHGQVEARLRSFSARFDRKPITVRKAAAARAFVEQLRREGGILDSPERLSSASLSSVEILKRLARHGVVHFAELAERVIDGRLDGRALKQEEKLLRLAQGRPKPRHDAHILRLQSAAFRQAVLGLLPTLYPPPALHCEASRSLAPSALIVDAVVALPCGFAGLKSVASASGENSGNSGARTRSAFHLGLASARVFEEFVFVFQDANDARRLAALLDTVPPCGVGVLWLTPSREVVRMAAPARFSPADLAVRFYGVLGALFERQRNSEDVIGSMPPTC